MAAAVSGACIREVSPDGELLMAFILSAKLGLFCGISLLFCQLAGQLALLSIWLFSLVIKRAATSWMADSAAAADITFSEQAVVYPGTAKKQAVSPIRIVPERNADPQTSLRALPCYGLAKLHGDYLQERPEVKPIVLQVPGFYRSVVPNRPTSIAFKS